MYKAQGKTRRTDGKKTHIFNQLKFDLKFEKILIS